MYDKLPLTWLIENVSVHHTMANHSGPKERVIVSLSQRSGLPLVSACFTLVRAAWSSQVIWTRPRLPYFQHFASLSSMVFVVYLNPIRIFCCNRDPSRRVSPRYINISANLVFANLPLRCNDELAIDVVSIIHLISCGGSVSSSIDVLVHSEYNFSCLCFPFFVDTSASFPHSATHYPCAMTYIAERFTANHKNQPVYQRTLIWRARTRQCDKFCHARLLGR